MHILYGKRRSEYSIFIEVEGKGKRERKETKQ